MSTAESCRSEARYKLVLLLKELSAWIESIVSWMPGGVGYRCRALWFRRSFGTMGGNATLGPGLQVTGPARIVIGDAFSCWRLCTLAACDDGTVVIGNHVSLNANVYLNACGGHIAIGNDVLIGPNVVLRSNDHVVAASDRPIRLQGHVSGRIDIEDDVWVAANVTVVGGVRIGRGAVVAANAVVTRDVAPYTIVGGVPAKPIGLRVAPSTLK